MKRSQIMKRQQETKATQAAPARDLLDLEDGRGRVVITLNPEKTAVESVAYHGVNSVFVVQAMLIDSLALIHGEEMKVVTTLTATAPPGDEAA